MKSRDWAFAIGIFCSTNLLATANEPSAPLRIERSTILTSTGAYHYMQSRGGFIPGDGGRVVVTSQEIERVGSHGFHDLWQIDSRDGGRTWSAPTKIESLRRTKQPDGYEVVIGDLCPKWHAATGCMLGTGKTFNFKDGKKEDRSREKVTYAVYAAHTNAWSELRILEMPAKDRSGQPILQPNSGCCQRVDLPSGDILLPVRYRRAPEPSPYVTTIVRCLFDGETLTHVEQGTELTRDKGRGLYEPSLAVCQRRYFLTLRADDTAFVATSADGLNFDPIVEWRFDDGDVLGSYNTQQHWAVHGDDLYLIYTRRGASNDHVFRHRAPLFIARVDPDRLCVIRATEQILIPENKADLGNFDVIDFNDHETWVVVAEGLAQSDRNQEPNQVILARILWPKNSSTP